MLFSAGVVDKVLHFQAEGSGPSAAKGAIAATGAGGVFLKPVKAVEVTTPATYRQSKEEMMRIVVKTWVLHV